MDGGPFANWALLAEPQRGSTYASLHMNVRIAVGGRLHDQPTIGSFLNLAPVCRQDQSTFALSQLNLHMSAEAFKLHAVTNGRCDAPSVTRHERCCLCVYVPLLERLGPRAY
jgi:hypothetical protein